MIQILTGKIGAGKTLHAVEFMYEALLEGRRVATNVEVFYNKLAHLGLKEKGKLIEEEQLLHIDLNENRDWHIDIPWGVAGKPTLVVLDEIHLFFNSRDYAETDRKHREMLSFLSQSRKAAVDILFVAQVASQVEKQFRSQAKNEIYINEFGNVHLPILGKIPLRQNQLTTRDIDSGMVMRRQNREYPKKFYGTYNTFAFLDETMQGQDKLKERLAPLRLRKPRGKEKKELLIKLSGHEILDNNSNSRSGRGWGDVVSILCNPRRWRGKGKAGTSQPATSKQATASNNGPSEAQPGEVITSIKEGDRIASGAELGPIRSQASA